jgi:hypothetical protein
LEEAEAALGVVPRGFFVHSPRPSGNISVAKSKEPINPFYVLVVIVGIVFVVTACAFAVMSWRATQPRVRQAGGQAEAPAADRHPLMVFLDKHGLDVLTWELIGLGGATFGAMWLDGLRSRRAERQQTRAADDNRAEPGSGIR